MRNSSLSETLKSILQLGKFRISVPVALTGFLGYYRASPELDLPLLYCIAGILFLAMGSSTFNQVQEMEIDKSMKRTRNRPLPSGRVSPSFAIITGTILSLTGLTLLILTHSVPAVLIGVFTMFWYNLVYTPLKRVTPFAVLPGALIGALPPLIGWTAAGGSMIDREILMISFFLFIGQMPHYWLLLMKVGDEFKDAGLPVITALFSKNQLRSISYTWIFAAGVTVAMFPALHIIHNNYLSILLICIIILFLVRMFLLSFRGEIMVNWKKSFITVNLFYLFNILLLIADKATEPYIYGNIIPF